MPSSGLLISCAIPAASRPAVLRRSAWKSWRSSSRTRASSRARASRRSRWRDLAHGEQAQEHGQGHRAQAQGQRGAVARRQRLHQGERALARLLAVEPPRRGRRPAVRRQLGGGLHPLHGERSAGASEGPPGGVKEAARDDRLAPAGVAFVIVGQQHLGGDLGRQATDAAGRRGVVSVERQHGRDVRAVPRDGRALAATRVRRHPEDGHAAAAAGQQQRAIVGMAHGHARHLRMGPQEEQDRRFGRFARQAARRLR